MNKVHRELYTRSLSTQETSTPQQITKYHNTHLILGDVQLVGLLVRLHLQLRLDLTGGLCSTVKNMHQHMRKIAKIS